MLVETSGGWTTVTEWARGGAAIGFRCQAVPGLTLEERLEDSLFWLTGRSRPENAPGSRQGDSDGCGGKSIIHDSEGPQRAGEGL